MTGPRARGPKRGRGAIGAGLQAQGRGGIRRGERLPGAAPVLLPYALALLLTCAFWEASSLGVLAFSDTEKALLQERGPRDGPGVPRGDLYAVLGVPRGARPEGVSAALSRAALEWWQGEGRCAGEAPTGGVGRALEVRSSRVPSPKSQVRAHNCQPRSSCNRNWELGMGTQDLESFRSGSFGACLAPLPIS